MYVYMHGCTNGPSVVVRAMCVRVYVVVKAQLNACMCVRVCVCVCVCALYGP